jgi:phage FluMu protein Com
MPIQFQCTHCGHSLSVASKLAGKKGKCPKCQGAISVPTPQGVATVSESSSVKTTSGTTAGPKVNPDKLSALLDEVGMVERKGPVCPSCRASVRAGTVVCVNCGFHFETQKNISGFRGTAQRPEFDNLHLQQAVTNMSRETEMDSRREKATMPWWVLASFLIGAVILCAAGVVLVDANFGEPAPEDTRLGRIQRVPVFVILGTTVGVTGLALAIFAHFNICIFGFQRKLMHGLGCFFLPFLFSLPYGIMNWTNNKAPIKGLFLAAIFIGVGVWLILYGGGFEKLNGIL